jgi:enamine deaminase RidA (YjgF/YER057c/UK114 family)
MSRLNVSSRSPWEDKVGYSRAVRVGNCVEVAGTTAMDGDRLVAPGDMYGQTLFIFSKIQQALEEAGASLADVVRTRMYITRIADWELAAKAHGEIFSSIRPVSTLVEVSSLIQQDLLIEIEVTAILAAADV